MERREFVKLFGGLAFVPLAFLKKQEVFKPDRFIWDNSKDFHNLVVEHQYDWPASNELAMAFQELAEKMLDSYKHGKDLQKKTDREDIVQECVLTCFDRLKRFAPERGKAYFYFTTIIMSIFLQNRHRTRDFTELYEKYQAHLRKIK
jgi:hypothetical protein